jgi:energy-converting hydrogenase Eha subunit G
VIGGRAVAVVGIMSYCLAGLGSGVSRSLEARAREYPEWSGAPLLGILGLGALLWLAGSMICLLQVPDGDPGPAPGASPREPV